MAKIKCLGSSSSGNCYLLQCEKETLIIEIGVPWKDIISALDYDLSKVVGICASHIHGDHINPSTLKNALKSGLSVYSNEEVAKHYAGVKALKNGSKMRIGESFVVQPISLKHSVENVGFLIENPELGRLVFATDCSSFPYKIKNVNHFLIEANNDPELVLDNLLDNEVVRSQYEQHLSIDDCVDALKRNYSPSLQTVMLLHLSAQNSDSVKFRTMVEESLGFDRVFIADAGVEVELFTSEF